MQTILYRVQINRPDGTFDIYRNRVHGVVKVQDEEYPPLPGVFMRCCYNAAGQVLCGPLVSEIVEWTIEVEA